MSTKSKFKGIVVCTKAQYEALTEKDTDKVYFITDDDLNVVQATGTSTTDVMSQDATTKAINSALGSVETLLADIDTGSGV